MNVAPYGQLWKSLIGVIKGHAKYVPGVGHRQTRHGRKKKIRKKKEKKREGEARTGSFGIDIKEENKSSERGLGGEKRDRKEREEKVKKKKRVDELSKRRRFCWFLFFSL